MRPVHQVIAAAAPADAITGQALAWREVLAGWGHRGEIVAEHVHPALRGSVRRLDAGGETLFADDRAAIILRYSVWSACVDAALAARGRVVLWYHNITPGELLRPWNAALAQDCDRARAALPRLRGRAGALVADSAFNAAELAAAGMPGASVIPLLLKAPARPPSPAPHPGAPVILSVGRIVPSKRLDDVIKTFALYQRHHAPEASLALVGGHDGFESYRAALGRLVERVGAQSVTFTGRVPEAERDAWYARASAYLCMSAHEGFCAPLVEAIARGVPVVARDAGAVRETLAGAGIVIEPDLPLAAEALHEVVSSPSTRAGLAAAAAARVRDLSPAAVAERLRAALAPVLAT